MNAVVLFLFNQLHHFSVFFFYQTLILFQKLINFVAHFRFNIELLLIIEIITFACFTFLLVKHYRRFAAPAIIYKNIFIFVRSFSLEKIFLNYVQLIFCIVLFIFIIRILLRCYFSWILLIINAIFVLFWWFLIKFNDVEI